MSLADNKKFEVYTSPLCLAIAFYFSSKKSSSKAALKKIKLLASKLKICTTDAIAVQNAIQNPSFLDFEDGLQYYSAANHLCEVIITEDQKDFYFSEIPVLSCQNFLLTYVLS